MNQQEWIEYFELVNGRKRLWLKWTGDGAKTD